MLIFPARITRDGNRFIPPTTAINIYFEDRQVPAPSAPPLGGQGVPLLGEKLRQQSSALTWL